MGRRLGLESGLKRLTRRSAAYGAHLTPGVLARINTSDSI